MLVCSVEYICSNFTKAGGLLKILFVSHQASFVYGGEIVTLAMMEALKQEGVEVHFASPHGAYADRAKLIAHWHDIPSVEFNRSIWGLYKFLSSYWPSRRRLREIIAEYGIDIVHAQSLKAAVYARAITNQVVWHHHNILPATFANDLWLRWLAKGVSGILVPSKATKAALLMAGLEEKHIDVLENGFSVERWKARKGRVVSDAFIALYIGELSHRKGIDLLPGLLSKLAKKNTKEVKLLVVGEALAEKDYAAAVLGQLSELKGVSLLGRRDDIPALLQTADVLLVPSRQDPLPTVIVEAMLSGVPVLASPVGGIPEMVRHGETGYLCESVDEYAERISALQKDERLWQALSRGARAFAEENFSITKVVKKLLQFYQKL